VLAQYGWTEAAVRAHSLDWVGDTWTAIDEHAGRRFRAELAGQIQAVYAATAGVHGGEEAYSAMQDSIQSLLSGQSPNGDGEVDYLLDPDAKPDEAALRMWAGGGGWGGATTPQGAPDRPSGISYQRMTREEYERAIRSN
jgi:hypothetical protein